MIEDILLKEEVSIPVGGIDLVGELELPKNATSIIIFAHGSGSAHLSPRSQYIASELRNHGMGTFLFDLLSIEEDTRDAKYNLDLLTDRLVGITEWVITDPRTQSLQIGYFGAGTGAASSLKAAAAIGSRIRAVVSRSGRPDLVMPILPEITAATLLIVSGMDAEGIMLNRESYKMLSGIKELLVIPGDDHEHVDKFEEVARHAADWFNKYLTQ